jgi:hypothetical protein
VAAGTYNITIDQGSDFAIELQISEDGTAKNLTGYSARSQIRTTKTSETIAASFTCTVYNAAEGRVRMSLPAAESSVMDAEAYVYDLELFTAGDASVTRELQGSVTVTQSVTR